MHIYIIRINHWRIHIRFKISNIRINNIQYNKINNAELKKHLIDKKFKLPYPEAVFDIDYFYQNSSLLNDFHSFFVLKNKKLRLFKKKPSK